MRIYIFTTIFIFVFLILTLYISKRLVNKLHFKTKYKNYLNVLLMVNLLGVVGYMITRYYPIVPNSIYFLLSIPIGIIFLLFTTTVLYDFFSYTIEKTAKNEKRRAFFKKSLDVISLGLAVSINAKAIYNARDITTENVTIKIKDLQQDYSIVQISDIHIGGLINAQFMRSLVQNINALTPDLVVITGDLIDTDILYAQDALNELKNIQSKYGTYFILGNHEYFHNVKQIIDHVQTLGIKVLENESVYIGEPHQGFNLAGVYDMFGYRIQAYMPDIKKALSQRHKDSPTLLLAHQPKYIYEVPSSVDLVLSGHTHGGQLIPFNLLVRLVQPYIKGLHQHNESTQIYVNKGTGFWGPPMRLGASSEITHILLISK